MASSFSTFCVECLAIFCIRRHFRTRSEWTVGVAKGGTGPILIAWRDLPIFAKIDLGRGSFDILHLASHLVEASLSSTKVSEVILKVSPPAVFLVGGNSKFETTVGDQFADDC